MLCVTGQGKKKNVLFSPIEECPSSHPHPLPWTLFPPPSTATAPLQTPSPLLRHPEGTHATKGGRMRRSERVSVDKQGLPKGGKKGQGGHEPTKERRRRMCLSQQSLKRRRGQSADETNDASVGVCARIPRHPLLPAPRLPSGMDVPGTHPQLHRVLGEEGGECGTLLAHFVLQPMTESRRTPPRELLLCSGYRLLL